MKIIDKIKNAKIDVTHLVKRTDSGNYDVTNVVLLGMFTGSMLTIAGYELSRIVNNIMNNIVNRNKRV